MTGTPETDPKKEMLDWWRTSIIDMEPGVIRYRGYAIEEMIGNVSFTEMIWLMTRGELPDRGRCLLLAPVALIETPTRQHTMLPMAAAGADEAVRPAQPDQRRAALLLGAEGLPKRLVAQTTHARCNLEPHNRGPSCRTY